MGEHAIVNLPLSHVALFSSGVGYYRRKGAVDGPVVIELSFSSQDISDVLKSLVVVDPSCEMPVVTYPGEDMEATLGSLKPDLGYNPGLSALLNSVRGATIDVTTPSGTIRGQVVGVEDRWDQKGQRSESYLSVYESSTIQVIPAKTILSYTFMDKEISADIERAMDVLLSASTTKMRTLSVNLDGHHTRDVRLAYVTETPVWKAAYRLDLSEDPAFMQGWAIVDNSSDVDWVDVQLSLFVGRLTSFTQSLYHPYHVNRPEVPVSIAGVAEARIYDGDVSMVEPEVAYAAAMEDAQPLAMARQAKAMGGLGVRSRAKAASGKPAGEQFAFTFEHPVTLNRHRSAMLPLTQGDFDARKMSILSGQNLDSHREVNPALGVRVTNNTGVALPAGPITVFDDGLYAGDALVEFLASGATRLLSYGDDLSLRACLTTATTDTVAAIRIAQGILRAQISIRVQTTYTLVNDSKKEKTLLVEHPRGSDDETIVKPAKPDEVLSGVYRFTTQVPPGTSEFIVESRRVAHEEMGIIDDPRSVLMHFSDSKLPKKTQAALEKAVQIRQRVYRAETDIQSLESSEEKLVADQARVRENLAAVGASSRSGAAYQARLEELEDQLIDLAKRQEVLRNQAEAAGKELADFIASLDLDEVS